MNVHPTIRATTALLMLLAPSAGASTCASGVTRGQGRVFLPNPVAALQDQSLTNRKDADYAALQPAYRTVTLTNLTGI